ncbi:MAG: plasmid maintenance system antidote protein [Candidatus Magnetoglobus multicellularis str. Araruama]|uniref:Plasmid maintenance system antidote protein n=1 Tax=Candidatus Magnetoglobus multicellularis str. Araruama TaxID=890399 RepID=A0A1V1PBK2_9BACT|nr:MAG: plasmid maintenance system antidote protein [Candidatus Magnetoglobus multicellularis str. Araruama]
MFDRLGLKPQAVVLEPEFFNSRRSNIVRKVILLSTRKLMIAYLDEFEEKIGIKKIVISNIIKHNQSISPEIALKLSRFFNTQPDFWMNLQTAYDLWYAEGNRGTDEPFYKLMQLSSEAMLKLIGASHTSGYEAKAIVLKEKTLYPDIMAIPIVSDNSYERVFIEFQGYNEKMIRSK